MISVKVDATEFVKKMNNAVQYSDGFLEGIQMSREQFNKFVAGYTVEALERYIDARARMNPEALHHVYEFNSVGQSNGRLFKFKTVARGNNINISGSFLPSSSVSNTSREPFINKAEIMENGISIVITPRGDNPLVFENNGELVFTRNSISIDHPGGDQVAGSFGRTIDDFFNNYFTNAILYPLFKQLENPKEYDEYFAAGTKSGKSIGVRAGRKYFILTGGIDESI